MSRRDKILETVTKKPAPSVIRKTYIGRLVLRCLIFLACVLSEAAVTAMIVLEYYIDGK